MNMIFDFLAYCNNAITIFVYQVTKIISQISKAQS